MMESTHAHITAWVIALILFLIALGLSKSKGKGFKITHMILRLFYLFIILTGALLFFKFQTLNPALYGVKMLLGFVVIAMFEMILVKLSKGKPTTVFWILLLLSLGATIYLGFKLPL